MDSAKISNEFYENLGADGLAGLKGFTNQSDVAAVVRAVTPMLSPCDRIVDLACGYGRVTLPLAAAGYRIEGIDLASTMIKAAKNNARKRKLNVKFLCGDMRDLPYQDASRTMVLCFWSSFNHLLTRADQLKTLNELHRVLKSGGMAFLEMDNGERKYLRTLLRLAGTGADHRILRHPIRDLQIVDYIHDRATLRSLCRASKFRRWTVAFKNIGKKRRIVMVLYK